MNLVRDSDGDFSILRRDRSKKIMRNQKRNGCSCLISGSSTLLILRQVHHRSRAVGITARLGRGNKCALLNRSLNIETIVDLIHHIGILAQQDNRRTERLLKRIVHIGQLVGIGRVGRDACVC